MEQRRYYCQNWRADVVVILTEAGVQDERVWYSAYGVPFGMPAGDTDSDGDFDTNDQGAIAFWEMMGTYDVRGDVNLDGSVTSADAAAATAESLGWEVLSGIDSRKGYAGYEHAPELAGTSYHVRYRVLKADLGRWLTRDPEGYSDGMSLYAYVQGMSVSTVDPMGLRVTCAASLPGQGCIAWIDEDGRRTSAPTKSRPPAPPLARFPPMLSSLGPSACFGGGCNPVIAGAEFLPECDSPSTTPPPGGGGPSTPAGQGAFYWNDCPSSPGCQNGYERKPGAPLPKANGCGSERWHKIVFFVAQFDFTDCCNLHDLCYAACGANKAQCDTTFLNCMLDRCSKRFRPERIYDFTRSCRTDAKQWALLVRKYGQEAFCAAQQANCQCKAKA